MINKTRYTPAHRLKLHTRYARYYELFFEDSYRGGAEVIHWILRRHHKRPIRDLLDIMCGTGGHLLELVHKGYRHLVGVDASREMVQLARKKLNAWSNVEILFGDVSNICYQADFDAAYCWFNSMQYFFDDDDLSNVLRRIYMSLRANGSFIVDMRNPQTFFPFVESLRPQLPKDYTVNDGPVRFVNRIRDITCHRQCRIVTYHTEFISEGPEGIQRQYEKHSYRFITLAEYENLLKQAGFLIDAIYGESLQIRIPFDEKKSNKMVVVAHKG